MSLFLQYLATYNTALKELNGMLSAKITQLRSDRTKMLYKYFHDQVLPAMPNVEPKTFKAIIKSLSQAYRNKQIDVMDVLSQIDPLLKGKSKPSLTIDTNSPSPRKIEKEVPESPSHKISEKKKKVQKKKCIEPSNPIPIPVSQKPKKKMIKKLCASLAPPSPIKEALTESESDTE